MNTFTHLTARGFSNNDLIIKIHFIILKTQVVCNIIAMLLHFSFLSVFGWMMMEGMNLYFKIVKVYGSEKNRMPLYIGLGYGVPAGIVAICAAIRFDTYSSPAR